MSSTRALVGLAVTLALGVGIYLALRGVGERLTAPLPDLKFVTFVKARPMFPVIGQEAELEARIGNQGEGEFQGELQVVAYSADPREGGNPEPLTSGRFEGRIAAGETTIVTLPFKAVPTLGPLTLYFAIDPEGDHREADRENNVVMSNIHVVQPPEPIADLEFSEIRFDPPTPVAGQDFAIVAVIANRGDAATGSPVVVDLYVNDPIGPQPRLPGTHRLTAPPLGPGETAEVLARTRFDQAQMIGVFAQVNTDGAIPESDLTNNVDGPAIVAVGTAQQSGKPDLVVESIQLDPPTPVAGSSGVLRIRVANRGAADTPSEFSVNVEYGLRGGLGPGFPPDDPDEPDWFRDLRFLAAGQSYDLPPIGVGFPRDGEWTVRAEIDPYQEVDEGDQEGNNVEEMAARVSEKR